MITTRLLLPAASTAGWISLNLHSRFRRRFWRRIRRAALRLSTRWSDGRMSKPLRRARRIDARSSVIEFGWHTTLVLRRWLLRRAVPSVFALGTSPPVAGEIDVSGAGSGQ